MNFFNEYIFAFVKGSPKKSVLPASVLGSVRSSTPDRLQDKDSNTSTNNKNLSDLPISPLYLSSTSKHAGVKNVSVAQLSSVNSPSKSKAQNKQSKTAADHKTTFKNNFLEDISDEEIATNGKDEHNLSFDDISDEDFPVNGKDKKENLTAKDKRKDATKKDKNAKNGSENPSVKRRNISDDDQSDPEIRKEIEMVSKKIK